MGKIAAVVVTYNRLSKLQNVVSAIRAQSRQPDSIVIVDNASTDATAEYLAELAKSEPRLSILALSENTGGAGGFSAGMEFGYQNGADFFWIMDDDGYPEPDALLELERGLSNAVAELGPTVPFACSVVEFTDGTICEMNNPVPTWDWGRLIVRGQRSVTVSQCSFVSVLIPRWVIQLHGLPHREYFIWFDDAEYTRRIAQTCPGVQVLDSRIIHDMGLNQGVNFEMVDQQNVWKFEYGARNEGSYTLHRRGRIHYLVFLAVVSAQMARGRVPYSIRRRIWKQILSAIRFNPAIRYPPT